MSMNTRRSLVTVLAIGLMVTPLVVAAGGAHHGKHGGCGHGMGQGMGQGMGPGMGPGMGMHAGEALLGPLGDRIGLTEEQKTQIRALIDEAQPTLDTLRNQLATAHQTFMDSQDPAVFDEAAIRTFAASTCQIQTDMMVATARLRTGIHSVLTAEQQQQLTDLRATWQADRGSRHGARGGRGAGSGAGNGAGNGAGQGAGAGSCPYAG